jgi:hypothetical protein
LLEKGRGHNPRWPLSQEHHSGRIIYDSDPVGIPLLGEAANPHPSEWDRGEQVAFMEPHRGESVGCGSSKPAFTPWPRHFLCDLKQVGEPA